MWVKINKFNWIRNLIEYEIFNWKLIDNGSVTIWCVRLQKNKI